MAGLGLVVLWAGYTSVFLGLQMIRGTPIGFLDAVLPGRRQVALGEIHQPIGGLLNPAGAPTNTVLGGTAPATIKGGYPNNGILNGGSALGGSPIGTGPLYGGMTRGPLG